MLKPHPNRRATTLAQRELLPPDAWEGPFQQPGAGSVDARVDLKLLAQAARTAVAERGTPAATERLQSLDGDDLWAGTVRDGTARGVMVALEEVISLCRQPAAEPPAPQDDAAVLQQVEHTPRELKRLREFLVASDGARMRFSRKNGVLFVDRSRDVQVRHAIAFEDRADTGTLDGFEPVEGERPRLFSPAFLRPVHYAKDPQQHLLQLAGQLGRGPQGYPCRLTFVGRSDERHLRIAIAIDNRHNDHRLRIRFQISDDVPIGHCGTPGWETVHHAKGHFRAATLVRACGRLQVGDDVIEVPDAQCSGWVEHHFTLGGTA